MIEVDKKYLFSRKSEFFLNSFSLFLLVACISDVLLSGKINSINNSLYVQFNASIYSLLAAYLFFNTVHVPTTFINLFLLPEFQNWQKEKKSFFKSFKIELLLAFLVFFFLAYYGNKTGFGPYQPLKVLNPDIYFFSAILFILLTALHGLGQSYGLSMILHKTNEVAGENKKAEKIEKRLFQFLFVFNFILVFKLFWGTSILLTGFKEVRLFATGTYITATCVLLILLNCFNYNKKIRWRKFIFLTRIIAVPMLLVTPMAGFMLMANHGMEYAFFTKNIVKNSKTTQQNKKLIWILIFLICSVWAFLTLPREFNFMGKLNAELLFFILALTTAVDLTHFWLDRVIYQFKDETSRKFLLPLVISK